MTLSSIFLQSCQLSNGIVHICLKNGLQLKVSAIARDATGKSGNHIGKEVDFYTWYEVNREVHVGVGVGHMLPGEFLAHVIKGAAYTYPYFVIDLLDGKRVH